jgi:hypothetical protein
MQNVRKLKEDTTCSMGQFNEYINKYEAHRKNVPKDWVFIELKTQLIIIIKRK